MKQYANSAGRQLQVVMYHYVRHLPSSRYPRLHGMMLDAFRQQIAWIACHYEMATLESALAFLQGTYRPAKDLCIFTFDDGLKEHYTDVTPILSGLKIQGLFGIITSCVEDHIVAPVHMNHFLMAEMEFEAYQSAFIEQLKNTAPDSLLAAHVDPDVAQRSYPLDHRDVATFKFLFNFALDAVVRDRIVQELFEAYIGDQTEFARELYMSWEEIRQLQRAGMLVAGHTHRHRPLSALTNEELISDLRISRGLLDRNLDPQHLWPFSYPYGKKNSYSGTAMRLLELQGYDCAFNTEAGQNTPGKPVFELNRIDCNGAIQYLQA